jgi:hypothetical protein
MHICIYILHRLVYEYIIVYVLISFQNYTQVVHVASSMQVPRAQLTACVQKPNLPYTYTQVVHGACPVQVTIEHPAAYIQKPKYLRFYHVQGIHTDGPWREFYTRSCRAADGICPETKLTIHIYT